MSESVKAQLVESVPLAEVEAQLQKTKIFAGAGLEGLEGLDHVDLVTVPAGGILAGARSLPGHTGGWAILVGFLAVAGVVAMAGADWWRVRRGEQ